MLGSIPSCCLFIYGPSLGVAVSAGAPTIHASSMTAARTRPITHLLPLSLAVGPGLFAERQLIPGRRFEQRRVGQPSLIGIVRNGELPMLYRIDDWLGQRRAQRGTAPTVSKAPHSLVDGRIHVAGAMHHGGTGHCRIVHARLQPLHAQGQAVAAEASTPLDEQPQAGGITAVGIGKADRHIAGRTPPVCDCLAIEQPDRTPTNATAARSGCSR